MDRNFMTSHSIFAGLPHRFHAPFTQVATARPEPLKQHAERESDNDFPSTYFLLRQKSTLWRFVVGAENFIYGTTLLIYELRSDHAEEA